MYSPLDSAPYNALCSADDEICFVYTVLFLQIAMLWSRFLGLYSKRARWDKGTYPSHTIDSMTCQSSESLFAPDETCQCVPRPTHRSPAWEG